MGHCFMLEGMLTCRCRFHLNVNFTLRGSYRWIGPQFELSYLQPRDIEGRW